jgi:hypothetical protein
MRHLYRIGSVLGLAFVFGGAVASAQVGGAGGSGQAGGSPAGVAGGGAGLGGMSNPGYENGESSALSTRTVTSPPRNKKSAFGRVTTTRKEVVPSPSQAARSGGASSGAAAGPRTGSLHPFESSAANARSRAANAGGASDSSARQEQLRPTRPPAMGVRSVTHNYYPTIRQGRNINSNVAPTARGAKGRNPMQGGMGGAGVGGMGMGGMGMMGGARSGQNGGAARGGSAALPRR